MAGEQQTNGTRNFVDEATKMGWKPKEEFRGDPDRWVDAEAYVKRGEEFLPIVQATNRSLKETVEQLQTRLEQESRLNKANTKALEELTEAQREQTVQTQERTLDQIEAGITEAREAGNVQVELALLREHQTATDKLVKAKTKPTPQQQQQPNGNAQPEDMTKTPAFQQFLKDNPWFETDSVMRAASIAIQNDLTTSGKISSSMSQADRLSTVAEAVRKRFNIAESRPTTNRVEGGGGTTNSGTGKAYSDLPSEAKEACDRAGRRLQFGKGKKFENEAAWRQHYTDTYYSI